MALWDRELSPGVVPEPFEISEGLKKWEKELSLISSRHDETVAAAEAAFATRREELNLSLEEKREKQIAALNADIHKYMTMVQAQMDSVLQELREKTLVILEAEHREQKKELEKAYNRDRAEHWKKYNLVFDAVVARPVSISSNPCHSAGIPHPISSLTWIDYREGHRAEEVRE